MRTFRDIEHLSTALDYQGQTPKRFDRDVCQQAWLTEGYSGAPASYVEYFRFIGSVQWTCDTDCMAIHPPEGISGLNAWNERFRAAERSTGKGYPTARYTRFGTIDEGSSLCWDRQSPSSEPAIVRIFRDGEIVPCGVDISDFLLNYWLMGKCTYSEVNDIIDERLVVDVV